MLSYKRMRRSEAIADIHVRARDVDRAAIAFRQVEIDSDVFEHDPPATRRDVLLKFSQTIKCLRSSGEHDDIAHGLHAFARTTPKAIDSAWLRDLRELKGEIALEHNCVHNLLASILAGLGRPRLI